MFLEGQQQDTEKLWRYLFEEASLGIAVEDTEGKLLLTNRAFWLGRGLARYSEGAAYPLLPVSSGSASLAEP